MIERSGGEDRSEAIVRLLLGDQRVVAVGEGVGPVHALDQALRKALTERYPQLGQITWSTTRCGSWTGGPLLRR